MQAEGWYLDPFTRYEQRWFSDGTPTALVRTQGVEAHDEPPSADYSGEPTAAPEPDGTAEDLKRADGPSRADEPFSRGDVIDAAEQGLL